MISPDNYISNNSLQREGVLNFLNKYIHNLTFANDGTDRIMDIGCGTGDSTMQLLRPRLPKRIDQLMGTDISAEAIRFCREKYESNDEQVSYQILDIAKKYSPPNGLERSFTHIFSFYCLHWVDLEKALRNVYGLLKDGGEIMLSFTKYNRLQQIWRSLSISEKWNLYFVNYNKFPTEIKDTSVTSYKALLTKVGFDKCECFNDDLKYKYSSIDQFKNAIKAMNFLISHLDEDLQSKFIADTIKTCFTHKYIHYDNDNESVIVLYQMVTLIAKKSS